MKPATNSSASGSGSHPNASTATAAGSQRNAGKPKRRKKPKEGSRSLSSLSWLDLFPVHRTSSVFVAFVRSFKYFQHECEWTSPSSQRLAGGASSGHSRLIGKDQHRIAPASRFCGGALANRHSLGGVHLTPRQRFDSNERAFDLRVCPVRSDLALYPFFCVAFCAVGRY